MLKFREYDKLFYDKMLNVALKNVMITIYNLVSSYQGHEVRRQFI